MKTHHKLLILVLIAGSQLCTANPVKQHWTIDLYPTGKLYNPIKIMFSGKRYQDNNGTALTALNEPDGAEQFIRFVIQSYNQASPNTILELWHPDERDQFEFLGQDQFIDENIHAYQTGEALELRFLSRIDYGHLFIFHIAAIGLNRTKVIRYTIVSSHESNRYYLTNALKKGGEFYLFESYTKHLTEYFNQLQLNRTKP